jgi:hypothetical protein
VQCAVLSLWGVYVRNREGFGTQIDRRMRQAPLPGSMIELGASLYPAIQRASVFRQQKTSYTKALAVDAV